MTEKKEKKKKALLGSHKASPAIAVAIRELLKIREQRKILNAKSKVISDIIIAGGGGAAHGYRSYIYYPSPTRTTKTYCSLWKKPKPVIKLVKYDTTDLETVK